MIVGDVYHGIRSIPAHFTTQEFFKTVDQKLKAEGFFLMNIVSSIQGRQSEIFKTMLKTVASVFQFQSVYATNSNLDQLQNILILVSQNDLSDKLQQLSSSNQLESLLRNKVSISNIKFDQYKLLTDFDNPIEYLVSKSLSNQ